MAHVLDILKYILPSLVVMATAYYLIKVVLDTDAKKHESEHLHHSKQKLMDVKMKNKELVMPIRLQAYERIVLLLERMSPYSLVMRIHRPGMTAKQLQSDLVRTIRDEFEHNLSQQLYISNQAWAQVKEAKELMIKLINTATETLPEGADSTALSQRIFELSSAQKYVVTDEAIEYIKKEIVDIF